MHREKAAFVICVNNETMFEECLFYINRQQLPEEVEVYAVRGADSIFQAYQQVMEQSEAKYKVYMHQDVFLIYPRVLAECIQMFRENPQIGMIGLIGGLGFLRFFTGI